LELCSEHDLTVNKLSTISGVTQATVKLDQTKNGAVA